MPEYLAGVQKVEVTANVPTSTQPISGSVSVSSGTITVQNKIYHLALHTAALTTTTPFTSTIQDLGSTPIYDMVRLRVRYNQPVTVDIYHGTSSTVTSNPIQQTVTVPANTVTIIEFPTIARYYGIKITNTGTATTTIHETLSAWISR